MLVYFLLWGLIGIEISMGIYSLCKQGHIVMEKAYVRLLESLIWLLLILSGVVKWSIRWYGISIWFIIVTLVAVVKFVRTDKTKVKHWSRGWNIAKVSLSCLVVNFMLIPVMVFPQDSELKQDGPYSIQTVSYTWTDSQRSEEFTKEADNRKITVQFWYPVEGKEESLEDEGQFPLIIFSHGAFGIRKSNYSTYMQLASHGYVVCSMDHTYHSFITMQTDGKIIPCNKAFMENAMTISNQEDSLEKYEMIQSWQKLRVEDMTFCLKQIKERVLAKQQGIMENDIEAEENKETINSEVFKLIDLDHIGLMGHSLGGSTAAEVGRYGEGVKAVAVIDGTMLGEEIGFEDGKEIITDEPYPVPILNFYNGESYKEIEKCIERYPNSMASKSQKDAYEIVITNAGHMNFTDLPMISPVLAKILGTGEIEPKACMSYVNQTILEFFDGYLKGEKVSLPRMQQITI